MASPSITAIADAVAAEISAGFAVGLFAPAAAVSRAYLHQYPDASTSLNVSVEPATREAAQIARGKKQVNAQVLVMISQRVGDRSNATLDPLAELVEDLQDYYAQERMLTGISEVAVVGQVHQDSMYDQDMLYSKSTFVSYFLIDLWAFGNFGSLSLNFITPSAVSSGVPFFFTVTAEDADGNVATSYSGTLSFSSGDTAATFQAGGSMTSGVGIFSATLKSIANQVLTATDFNVPSITGASGLISVALPHFLIGNTATAGVGVTISVEIVAEDASDNPLSGYTGTVNMRCSDSTATIVPPSQSCTAGQANYQVTIHSAETVTLIATDSVTPAMTGSSTIITH
jgi:hypothetical protein